MNETFPLRSATDNAILMHREVHFGGNFPIMIEYYEAGGKGVVQEFDLEEIKRLATFEKQANKNLASMLLSGAEAEKVAQAKESYKKLRDLYESNDPEARFPILIADLILSESEDPQEEIEAIVRHQGAIVPAILQILKSDDLHDPLFPGYGTAPALAAHCLGLIGDKRAIISLFQMIGEGDIFDENMILDALKLIGEPAKEFLLHVVRGRPLNNDNDCAAIALLNFKDDPEVSQLALEMLKDPKVRSGISLPTYLALICEGLTTEKDRADFIALADDSGTSRTLKNDIKIIAKSWK